jgi:Spy/CpxP family protein refolding chaperone
MTNHIRRLGFALGFTTLGALASVGFQAVAQPPTDGPQAHERGQPDQSGPFMRLMDKIELSESQESELKDIKQSHLEERKANRGGRIKGEMLQMLASQDLDRQAAHAMIDDQLATQAELMHAHTDDYLDFIEALDPDQKDELAGVADQILQRLSERDGPELQDGPEQPPDRRSR